MKKTLLVLCLALMLVMAFSASAMAIGPFYKGTTTNGVFNANYANYLSWGYAQSINAADNGSPHGNYVTTSNKCAVCHAVHRAKTGGSVLTAIPDSTDLNTGATSPSGYSKGCAFCHAAAATAFSSKTVNMDAATGEIMPHENCSRCHITSPHGANASKFPALKARMLNSGQDAKIQADIDGGVNGLTVAMFDDTAANAPGIVLGAGYICSCHATGGAFPVNTPNATPASAPGFTGHRVTAMATTAWNQAGEYNAYYTGGGATGATSVVAYNDSNTCKTCHDAETAAGKKAFPHGYVNAAGDNVTESDLGGGLIWLSTAADSDDAHTLLTLPAAGGVGVQQDAANKALTSDGLCLKCHVNGDKTAGVGVTW